MLVIGADLALEHPLLSFQIRANYRHHQAHVYVVTPGPVREDKYSARAPRWAAARGEPGLRRSEGRARESQAAGPSRNAGDPVTATSDARANVAVREAGQRFGRARCGIPASK